MPDILPGLKGLSNLHPMFVHFPIAFWLAALTSILALILCVVAFFGRRYSGRVLRVVFFVGLLLVAGLLTVGSDRGGQLVYQYGISVQTVAALINANACRLLLAVSVPAPQVKTVASFRWYPRARAARARGRLWRTRGANAGR